MSEKAIPQLCVATCPFTGMRWELETCWQSFSNTEVNSELREIAAYLASQYCFSKPIDRRHRVRARACVKVLLFMARKEFAQRSEAYLRKTERDII